MDRYPALSHTFILREVQAVRAAGAIVKVASIRPAEGFDLHDPTNRAEEAGTFVVLSAMRARMALRLLAVVLRRPCAIARLVRSSFRRRTPGARAALWRLFYAAEAALVWDWAKRNELQHLHAHFANVASDVAELAAEHGRHVEIGPQTWSITIHGSAEFFDMPGRRLADKAANARFVAAIGWFARSQVMTVTAPEQWRNVHIVRCGLRLEDFARLPDDARTMTVLTVARLVPSKGIDLLMEAMVAVRVQIPDARLVVAGDGPYRDALERRAVELGLSEAVEFTGVRDAEELRELHARSGVFCLPSFAEGIPVVLMEAMALGTPVVATRVMGIPELIEDRVSGRLVRPGDVQGLAGVLLEVLERPCAARPLADAARAVIESEFDIRRGAHRLTELFAQECATAAAPHGRKHERPVDD